MPSLKEITDRTASSMFARTQIPAFVRTHTVENALAKAVGEESHSIHSSGDLGFSRIFSKYSARKWAKMFDVTPKTATKSTGVLRISLVNDGGFNLFFFQGERFEDPATGQRYISLAFSSISYPSGTINVESIGTGPDTELPANYEMQKVGFTSPRVTSIKTDGPIVGGTDDETDDELWDRMQLRIANWGNISNPIRYEEWALSVSGVELAKCVRVHEGPGTVLVTIGRTNPESRSLTEAKRQEVFNYITDPTRAPAEAAVTVSLAPITLVTAVLSHQGPLTASQISSAEAAFKSLIYRKRAFGASVSPDDIRLAVGEVLNKDRLTVVAPANTVSAAPTGLLQAGAFVLTPIVVT